MASGISLITTFMLLLAAALFGGAIAIRVKLPSIVGYIAGGVLIGTLFESFVDFHLVEMVAESGVILLLFALGVEFSFHKLRRILHAISWPAMAQIVLSIGLLLVLLLSLRFSFVPALYIAAAAALSSTAIVIKLLSEKGELETIPGEVATGWLVIQDLAVIPLLVILTAVATVTTSGEGSITSIVTTVVIAMAKAGAMLLAILFLGRHGVPKVLNAVVGFRNRELFLLTTIGIVFMVGLSTYALGLSVALGAFLAGLLVAETSQNHAVFSEIRPLRDLFAVVFFVSLGMDLPLASLVDSWHIIFALTLGVMVIKGGIIFGLLRFMGYHRKTAFMVGAFLTQVSEFGFVLAQSGLVLGALSKLHASILVAVTFVTIMISSIALTRVHELYYWALKILKKFPKFFAEDTGELPTDPGFPISDHVVICGYGRVGRYIGRALQMSGIPFLVVDYNHHVLKTLKEQGITTVYGDPADKDVLDYAQVDLAKYVVVAIPDRHTQEMIIANSVSLNRRVKIICRTHQETDQKHLKSLGVQTVVQPEFEAALTVVNKLFRDFGIPEDETNGKISRLKIEHGVN